MRLAVISILVVISLQAFGAEQEDAKPNLVPNGTFDADPGKLVNWDPLPKDGSVKWIDLNPERGKIIVFDLTKAVAVSTGVLFYSDFIPIEQGKKYRFSMDYKSLGPEPKPFVKGYALSPDIHGKTERREYYKKQIFVKEPSPDWKTISMFFTPKNPYDRGKHEIKWVRILLYAYLKPGQIYFDNIRIEKVE